jgi:hypothetical protein
MTGGAGRFATRDYACRGAATIRLHSGLSPGRGGRAVRPQTCGESFATAT